MDGRSSTRSQLIAGKWLTSMILPIDRKLEAYHDILSAQSKFDSKLSPNLFRKLVQTSNSL